GPFSFNIYTTDDKVNIWVLDKNVLRNRNKLLGISEVSVKCLLDQEQGQTEKWLPLHRKDGSSGGQVLRAIEFKSDCPPPYNG
ncbi:unnamed protein product, partial [Didymodactylos carnosus]